MQASSESDDRAIPPRRRGHRRITVPGTSGQPEQAEPQDVALPAEQPRREGADSDSRAEWLKAEKPPHWG